MLRAEAFSIRGLEGSRWHLRLTPHMEIERSFGTEHHEAGPRLVSETPKENVWKRWIGRRELLWEQACNGGA
jgi:hypothetical protein